MGNLEIHILPVLSDNYVFLIHDPVSGATACVDPAVAAPVVALAKDKDWVISHILITHPHGDHIGGILDIVQAFGAKVYGSRHDFNMIPKCDYGVAQGDEIKVGQASCTVMDVPGHMAHHVAYYFAGMAVLFCGDVLFPLGCGRLLGGTAHDMWDSLQKIRALPAETQVYGAHEYTRANADFAVSLDPENADLKACKAEVEEQRASGQPTVPTTLASEIKCNPFLRCDVLDFQDAVGMTGCSPLEVFTDVRRQKDRF